MAVTREQRSCCFHFDFRADKKTKSKYVAHIASDKGGGRDLTSVSRMEGAKDIKAPGQSLDPSSLNRHCILHLLLDYTNFQVK